MKKFLSVIILFGFVLSIGLIVFPDQSKAELSGSDFKAGNIISDANFFNGNAMTVASIQQFLEAKVPNCDTDGSEAYGGTTRAAYGTSQGSPPPYTCLKDFRQNIPDRNAE